MILRLCCKANRCLHSCLRTTSQVLADFSVATLSLARIHLTDTGPRDHSQSPAPPIQLQCSGRIAAVRVQGYDRMPMPTMETRLIGWKASLGSRGDGQGLSLTTAGFQLLQRRTRAELQGRGQAPGTTAPLIRLLHRSAPSRLYGYSPAPTPRPPPFWFRHREATIMVLGFDGKLKVATPKLASRPNDSNQVIAFTTPLLQFFLRKAPLRMQ